MAKEKPKAKMAATATAVDPVALMKRLKRQGHDKEVAAAKEAAALGLDWPTIIALLIKGLPILLDWIKNNKPSA